MRPNGPAVFNQPLLRVDTHRGQLASDRIGELIELTRESSKLAAREGPRKHPLNSKTSNVNLSDESHSNFLLNLPTGKEAHWFGAGHLPEEDNPRSNSLRSQDLSSAHAEITELVALQRDAYTVQGFVLDCT